MYPIDALIHHLESDFDIGKKNFVDVVRMLLRSTDCSMAELLDPVDDTVFLEPLLVSSLTTKYKILPLDQILFGFLVDSRRPIEIQVHSDINGIIYIPVIGYFITDRKTSNLTLSYDHFSTSYKLYDGGINVDFRFSPPFVIEPGNIELCCYNYQLFRYLFADSEKTLIDVEITNPTRQQIAHMSSALAIIRDVCPTYYYYLVRAIKKILIFNDSRLNSFADLSAHGVVFLNVGATDNEIFFIEDIAHQGGHVVFSTSTFHNNGLFDVDQNTPLRAFTGVLQETRSIYVVLHGLFTEIAIISCLDAYLDNGDLTSRYKHELEGRLAFIISRFAMDLKNMSYNGIFSVRGREMYHHFIQVFETIYEKRRSIIRESNFSNQPYTFNYQRFTELNHANI